MIGKVHLIAQLFIYRGMEGKQLQWQYYYGLMPNLIFVPKQRSEKF